MNLEEMTKEREELELKINKLTQEARNKEEEARSIWLKVMSIKDTSKKAKEERLEKTIATDEHKKLLKEMEFKRFENGGELVFMGCDGKRPFGNSDWYGDVARILDWKLPNDELSFEQEEKASQLLDELPYALNKILKELYIGNEK